MTSFDLHVAQQRGLIPPGETIRWSGAPPSGLLLRPSDALAIPFSLLWGGFAMFWESMAVQSGVLFMELWGVPFVAAGLYAIVGRFAWDAYVRAQTSYTVTDRAAYVVTAGVRGGIRRFSGEALNDVRVQRRADGSGSLQFGPDPAGRYVPFFFASPATARSGFEAIRNVDAAYAAILAAQRA